MLRCCSWFVAPASRPEMWRLYLANITRGWKGTVILPQVSNPDSSMRTGQLRICTQEDSRKFSSSGRPSSGLTISRSRTPRILWSVQWSSKSKKLLGPIALLEAGVGTGRRSKLVSSIAALSCFLFFYCILQSFMLSCCWFWSYWSF